MTASTLPLPVVQTTPQVVPAKDPTGNPLVYTVRSGDFLIGIASLLGVGLNDLLTVNTLSRQSLMYPGKRLVVPAGGRLPDSGPGSSPATGSGKVDAVIAFARAQLGEPYRFNSAGPDSWDCSGLTMAAYAQIGLTLPHYSAAQAVLGRRINWTTQPIRAGDLVFLETSPGSGVINHVGIAINSTQWIHAPRTGDVVKISTMNLARVAAVRRFVQES
ncbi:MAG: LysM peptidoglycan-binding domain-containing C40 family peptidase, partial [Actinomycetota bacterium]